MGARVVLDGVCCAHGTRRVVHEVSLVIEPGERVALTGTNGSGKTTLLRTLLGLHPLAAGRIEVDGAGVRTAADRDRLRRVSAWIPQRHARGRFPLLGGELLASSGAPGAARAAAARLGLGPVLERPVDTLSGGQLQRMYLARALGCVAAGARLVLADEPTAALDFAGQEQVAGMLAALPVTVLVVTHDRAVVAHCGRVLEMAGGRMREVSTAGPPSTGVQ